MAETTISKVYDVQITAEDALKQLAALKQQSAELRDRQKEVGEVAGKTSKEYLALGQQIKSVDAQARTYEKQIQSTIKAQNAQADSNAKLKAQLSLYAAELDKLGKSEEDIARRGVLVQSMAEINAKLKEGEEAWGNHTRSVGDYGKATVSLRAELRDMVQQLAVMAVNGEKGSQAYTELAAKAGSLRDAMDDVNQQIRVEASDTKYFDTIAQGVEGIAAAYGLWKSAATVLGVENEKVEETIKKLMVVTTALNSLRTIQNILQKQSAVSMAATNLLQKIGINQTAAEAKALAAKNTIVAAGTIGQKAAAAATWLWNAALAANPVVLVATAIAGLTLGVAALTGAFNKNITAQELYEKTTKRVEAAVKDLDRALAGQLSAIELNTAKVIEAAKQRGATAQEIAAIELQGIKEVANAEAWHAADVKFQQQQQLKGAEALQTSAKLTMALTREGGKQWRKAKEDYDNANESIATLTTSIEEQDRVIAKSLLTVTTRSRETADTINKLNADAANKEAEGQAKVLDSAYDRAAKEIALIQQVKEAQLKASQDLTKTGIAHTQAYEKQLFELQQAGQIERLNLQKKYGKLSAAEYAANLQILAAEQQTFTAKQANTLTAYFTTLKNEILSNLTKTSDEQIAMATKGYTEALKNLESLKLGEFEYLSLKLRLENQLQEEVKQIKATALAQQKTLIDDALAKQYQDELIRATDNEQQKLDLTEKMLTERLDAYKKAGLSVSQVEADIRANQLAQHDLTLRRELLAANSNHKKVYQATKKVLEAEGLLYADNADKQLEIMAALREAEIQYNEARIADAQRYLSTVSEIWAQITELVNQNSEHQKQIIELQYKDDQQALADKYALGIKTEAQYTAESLRLEHQRDKELAKIEAEAAKRDKAFRIYSAVTGAALAVIQALAAPPPMSFIFAGIAAAMGALQVATIASEPLPKAARGRYITGRSHAQGGEIVEAQAGEAIVNARSMSMYGQLVSLINELGGGVPFAQPYSDGGYALRHSVNSNATGVSKADMAAAVKDAFSQVQVVATIEDIRRADSNYAIIESRGKI